MKYPIVLVNFIDHTVNTSGNADPAQALVVGVLVAENKKGYFVKNWIFDGDIDCEDNVSSFIAKVPGLKMEKIGDIVIRGDKK